MIRQAKFQIGKSGVTDGVIESLTRLFKNHKQIRVSVLKSLGRDRENMKAVASKLESILPVKFRYKIIGFTLILFRKVEKSKTKSL